MDFGSTFFYKYQRFIKTLKIYLLLAGPGLIVMLADNDAGGITTYSVTGAKYGYGLIWFLLLLLPVAYVIQEMTVRLGAVTKRGHAEAIFDAFGSFWGWFSFIDLAIVNWLTLVTEFIGMTAALAIFHVPPVVTVLIVSIVMMLMVLQGKYWTWEKIAILFAAVNIIYIPAAFLVHPSVGEVLRIGLVPHFPGGFNSTLFFFLMANRDYYRPMDDLLPAKCSGRQGHEGKRYSLGPDGYSNRIRLHRSRCDLPCCRHRYCTERCGS
jgi:Mn2+/Fe2+ NRAMP family transporter